jgi:hypothetical protein
MTPADSRVAELLERWLASVELHARYLELDDAAYARVQDWPRHQRPTRWVVDLARSRLLDLRREVGQRQAHGDTEFATALELMSFLTTLLGAEHVERFIPLAAPRQAEPVAGSAQTSSQPGSPAPKVPIAQQPATQLATPRPAPARRKAPARPKTAAVAVAVAAPIPDAVVATVVADAIRFLSWGREWPQLASSIARLADRPPETEVWKILRQHRSDIEARALRRPN